MTHVATVHLASGTGNYEQRIRVRSHEIISDEPESAGGKDAGPAPYGLLAASLASCTSITLKMYADRKGWTLGHVEVDIVIERDGDAEQIARTIRIAAALTDEQRTRLGEIAEKTPVTKTLKRSMPIVTTII